MNTNKKYMLLSVGLLFMGVILCYFFVHFYIDDSLTSYPDTVETACIGFDSSLGIPNSNGLDRRVCIGRLVQIVTN